MRATDSIKTSNGNLVEIRHRRAFQKGVEWILADDSGSMCARLPSSEKRRIDALNEAIASFGEHIQTIAFGPPNSVRKYIGPTNLQGSSGATFLALALKTVKEYDPNYIIVISDGKVQDAIPSKTAAQAIADTCIIDTLYIGPDDPIAEGFMSRLATIGNGRFKRYDITKPNNLSLTQVVQGLLPPPEEIING